MTAQTSHILIVDDNLENIQVLGTILQQKNYRLAIVQNGIQALKCVEESPPDLILLDIMMPEMDGFQVCEALKNNPKTKDIEVIFITAAVAPDDELKGLQLGAVDYIHKPFSIPIVQTKVALHLERVHHKRLRDDVDRITRHDLKNPLNALMGYPQLMLGDDNLTAEQQEYLKQMLIAGNEMLHIINNSFDLFKMENGRYQYTPRPVDITFVIKRIFKDLQTLINDYRVNIKTLIDGKEHSAEHAFVVFAEHGLTYSLFANLIRNAIEACAPNDTITIEMRYEGEYGVIAITNPGCVPEELRAIFFEKYANLGKVKGNELDTYSAKLMTETQNGSIAMSSDNRETCITVRLPCEKSL